MDQVKCRIEIPDVEGLKPQEMTVGRHAIFSCEGDWNKSFDFTQAQVKLDEQDKYILKVFKAEARSGNSFDVNMTVYVAGEMQWPEMILTDGTNEIALGQQQMSIASVLQPAGPGQPPQKPYSYIFPMNLHWPLIYTALAAAAVVLFLVGLIYQLRRAARYARLIADLQQHKSSVSADLQFYKSLRSLEKQGYPTEELEKAFRLYVLRVFGVPMFVLSHRQILNFLKKRKRTFKAERQQIDVLLSEFEEAAKKKIHFSEAEKSDLVKKVYRFVDRTQNIQAVL